MFYVIKDAYNKKTTEGTTLMELFIATGKLKIYFTTRDVVFVNHGLHRTHRYDIQVLATYVSKWMHR